MVTLLLNEEAKSVFSEEGGKKDQAKEKAYETKQLIKEKRSEEYEVWEETVNLSQWF